MDSEHMEHKLHVVSRGELEDITRYGNTRGRPGSKAPSASNNGSRMYNPMSRGLPSSASLEMLQPDDVMGEVKQVYHPAKAFHKICMFNMSSTCSRAFVKFTHFVFREIHFCDQCRFQICQCCCLWYHFSEYDKSNKGATISRSPILYLSTMDVEVN